MGDETPHYSKRNIKPFDGTRYPVWKHRVYALLEEKDVHETILYEPPDEPDEEYTRKSRVARAIIIEHLSDTLLSQAELGDTPWGIIKRLEVIYERVSWTSQYSVEQRIRNLKLEDDGALGVHFALFDELLVELRGAGGNVSEQSAIVKLMMTLSPSYDSVTTALQATTNDAITLQFVKQKLLDHEVKLKATKGENANKVLHVGQVNNRGSNNRGSRGRGGFRGRFRGISRGVNRGGRGRGASSHVSANSLYNDGKCLTCGRKGHFWRECYYRNNNQRSRGNNSRGFNQRRGNFQQHSYNNNQQQYPYNSNNNGYPQQQSYNNYQPQQPSQSGANTSYQANSTPQENSQFAHSMFMVGRHVALNTQGNELQFILDSGATDHIVNEKSHFTSWERLEKPIHLAVAKRGESITATIKGSIKVTTDLGFDAVLRDVLFVPAVPHNLLSVRRLQNVGLSVVFDNKGGVAIMRGSTKLAMGKSIVNNLLCMKFTVNNRLCNQVVTNDYKLWHERFGHLSKEKFLQMKKHELYEGKQLISINPPDDYFCEPCIFGKQHRLPFAKSKDRSHVTRPLFCVFSDVCGKISPSSIDGYNYFITFTDEFTRYTVIYLLKQKSESFGAFKDFVAKGESHFNLKVAHFYIDNGREYLSNACKEFCNEKGIQFHLTVPNTPQQNGISERKNRTLVEKARAMIEGAELDTRFWGEAVLTAGFLSNITPTSAIDQSKTPYQLWHNKKPKIENLRIFGCTVYVHDKNRVGKFDKKSNKGILVGYDYSGYKIWILESRKFIIARDVIFDENSFKNTRPEMSDKVTEPIVIENEVMTDGNETDRREISGKRKTDSEISNESGKRKRKENRKNSQNDLNENELRRSSRIRDKSKANYTDSNENDEDYSYFATALMGKSFVEEVPSSYNDIAGRDDSALWYKAFEEEIESQLKCKTWEIVDCPEGVNIVNCMVIFSLKYDSVGNIARRKCRLVAKGCSQKYKVDYEETFAPVARITTFRMILSFAIQYNLLVHQMDVKTAFLNGELNEEIYMRIPEGIKVTGNNKVCKLNKSIYGLKQSARCWYEKFDKILKEHGFVNSKVDRCLYILDRGHISKNIYVLLYVDDILPITYDIETMINFKNYLKMKFEMTDLNEVKFFLGINVTRNFDTITLDQTTFLKKTLVKFNMMDCNPMSTPMESSIDYLALNTQEECNAPIRNLLGSLMYAMLCTRPDICFALNILSRYQSKTNDYLWESLKRILKYVKGSLNVKLIYKRNNYYDHILDGFADSDWARNTNDRISTSGYLFRMFESNQICWNSKKQKSVACSSTEAEYMAMFEAAKEACWLRSLLKSINLNINVPIIIYEDNTGCISLSENPVHHKRSKHIDIQYHFTREKVEEKLIKLIHVSTDSQLADHLTKPLAAGQFLSLRTRGGLKDVDLSRR